MELQNVCKHFTNTVSLIFRKLHAEVVVRYLQIKKVSHSEAKCLVQGFSTADKCQDKNMNQSLTLRPRHFCHTMLSE